MSEPAAQQRVVVRRVVRAGPPVPPVSPRARRPRSTWVVTSVGLVLLACLVASWAALSSDDEADDQRAAVAAARVRVAAMLTFSHEDLESDLSVASGNTTGPFRATYAERLRTLIATTWDQRKASMSSRVTSASFTKMHGRDVGVRLVVRSRLRAGSAPPDEQRFVVRVTMRGADSQWLVSDLRTS
ncbi:MAG: hypothetical protein EON52_22105 [Actinomycetales bacterium]|nr:MAG: hypothetical protein EON52_22105 [Actinomycetales bacterium]